MRFKKLTIGILVLVGLLAGSLAAGALLGGTPGKAAAAPAAQTTGQCADDDGAEAADTEDTEDVDDVEEENECGPQDADEAGEAEDGSDANEVDKSDEVAPTNGLGISPDQAQAIVEDANPGTATLAVEFDRENGHDIFEVELDNGRDVKVDATSGQILGADVRDAD